MVGRIAFVGLGQAEEPKAPEIPGITVDDFEVNGCVEWLSKSSMTVWILFPLLIKWENQPTRILPRGK